MIVNCARCGKPFNTPPSRPGKYCSLTCYEAVREDTPKKIQTFTCEHCGKTYQAYVYPNVKYERQFCSKPCHYAARQGMNNPQWARQLMNCDHCGKEFHQLNHLVRPGKGNFCSRKCAAQHTAKQAAATKKNGKMVPCLNCGKETYKIKSRQVEKIGNFCSPACIGEYRARVRVTITCAYCGQEHLIKASYYNKGAKYCSRDCAQKGTAPTTLEVIGYQLLDTMQLEHIRQYRIGKWIVDAYVPSLNLVVQFDGDYWHDTDSAKQRDARHAKYMQAHGIPFVRVRESELRKSFDVLRDRIIHICGLQPSQVPAIPTTFVPALNWRGE